MTAKGTQRFSENISFTNSLERDDEEKPYALAGGVCSRLGGALACLLTPAARLRLVLRSPEAALVDQRKPGHRFPVSELGGDLVPEAGLGVAPLQSFAVFVEVSQPRCGPRFLAICRLHVQRPGSFIIGRTGEIGFIQASQSQHGNGVALLGSSCIELARF